MARVNSELFQFGKQRMKEYYFFAVCDSLEGHVSEIQNLPVLNDKKVEPRLMAKTVVTLKNEGKIICAELKKQGMIKFDRKPEITIKEIQKIYKLFYAYKCVRGKKQFTKCQMTR